MWGRGWERGGIEGSPHATRRGRRSLPAAHRHLCACDRRAEGGGAPWSQRDASSQRNRKFGGRGDITSGRKIAQLVFQSQARRSRRHASRPGPESLAKRVCRAPRARPVKKKEKKGDRPKGHRQPRRRTGCTPETHSSHALQNDTPPPEPAPAGMLQGLPIAAERRAVGWGKWGRWRGRCDVDRRLPAAPGARERRGAACADHLPDTFPPLPVNGCRFGREPGSLAGGG